MTTAKITGGVIYECVNCGTRITSEQVSLTPEIKCPNCGFRVLKKIRAQVVKRVKSL